MKQPGYYIHTFGCQMNVHDSLRIEEILKADNYQKTADPQKAQLIVLNTCSVREKAEHKLRSEVGKLAKFKKENPELMIAVTGCVAQQEGQKLLQTLDVDIILGPDNIQSLIDLIQERKRGLPPRVLTEFDVESPQFLAAQPEEGVQYVSAFVTTMKGCDERCSFCVVPYTRGKERYRPKEQIIEEIKRHVAMGVKEIVLLGQTVDSYRDVSGGELSAQNPDETHFPFLLRMIAKEVSGLQRLRYTSPHPRHTTDSLVNAHREIDILARHVHLPVQSGSNRVLKRMIRRYTREEYIARAKKLKSTHAGFTLSTDIIVGFPGETEQDFLETLSLVEEIGFTGIYGFKYSRRPYTPALKLADDVSNEQKEERLARLFKLGEQLTAEHLLSLQGTVQEVLFEGPSKLKLNHVATFQGRTRQNEIVHVAVDSDKSYGLTGRILQVKIMEAYRNSLRGEFLQSDLQKILPQKSTGEPMLEKQPKKRLPLYIG